MEKHRLAVIEWEKDQIEEAKENPLDDNVEEDINDQVKDLGDMNVHKAVKNLKKVKKVSPAEIAERKRQADLFYEANLAKEEGEEQIKRIEFDFKAKSKENTQKVRDLLRGTGTSSSKKKEKGNNLRSSTSVAQLISQQERANKNESSIDRLERDVKNRKKVNDLLSKIGAVLKTKTFNVDGLSRD